MLISSRTKEIIERVINSGDYISVDQLSNKMNISQRTVYRELPEVTAILKNHEIELITTSKKGIVATGTKENFDNLRSYLNKQETILLVEPDHRADYILFSLIQEEDYIKAEAIAIINNYPVSTVRSDLKKIRTKLAQYELQMIQQKGQGVIINGTLIEKNHLMTDIILERVEENTVYRWLNDVDESNPFLNRVEEFGFKKSIQRTHFCLKSVLDEEEYLATIKTRDYLEVVFLLGMMIHYHYIEEKYTKYMEAHEENDWQRNLVNQIVNNLEEVFAIKLSKKELTYIQWVIQISMGTTDERVTTLKNHTLNDDIMKFIECVEDRMGISLLRDQELREGLYAHMEKALARIRSNMQITNPALEEIRENYGELFIIIQQEIQRVFKREYFPDDEIGYLLLYFAITIDKYAKKAFRVLVVCSGGMGSSKMLANSLEREIPEVQIVKTISVITLNKEKLSDYELILSTIPLHLSEESYMRVSPMLHKNETLKIKEKIRRHKHSMLRRIDAEEKNDKLFRAANSEEILTEVSSINNLFLKVLSNFSVIDLIESRGLLHDKNLVLKGEKYLRNFRDANGFKAVREDSIFMIPTTSIAYYEGIDNSLVHPLIFITSYSVAHQLENKKETYSHAVFVLYTENMSKVEREGLKFLVEFILEDTDFLDRVVNSDETYLKNLIAYRMRRYIGEILKG